MTGFVLAKAFSGTCLWKWLWCILGRNKLASWFKFKRLKLVEGPNLKHWPLSKKALTVFNTGSSLWFKPFNGFFHLNAIVLSFLSWWSAVLWWPERVTACCASCYRFVTALLFLCCDWMTMRHFVLPHRVFTCPSDTRLPIRNLLGFFVFFNRGAQMFFFSIFILFSSLEDSWRKTRPLLQSAAHGFACWCGSIRLNNFMALHFSPCISNILWTKKNPGSKTTTGDVSSSAFKWLL